ncbi:hypothetical protein CI610_00675 [invertebrate metagenome]|uniref:Uncharacterized protein n=1 Tax=invertebrate metagenome TaxID=1711999 RepID=A0A2H9TAS8_9ZZZZ
MKHRNNFYQFLYFSISNITLPLILCLFCTSAFCVKINDTVVSIINIDFDNSDTLKKWVDEYQDYSETKEAASHWKTDTEISFIVPSPKHRTYYIDGKTLQRSKAWPLLSRVFYKTEEHENFYFLTGIATALQLEQYKSNHSPTAIMPCQQRMEKLYLIPQDETETVHWVDVLESIITNTEPVNLILAYLPEPGLTSDEIVNTLKDLTHHLKTPEKRNLSSLQLYLFCEQPKETEIRKMLDTHSSRPSHSKKHPRKQTDYSGNPVHISQDILPPHLQHLAGLNPDKITTRTKIRHEPHSKPLRNSLESTQHKVDNMREEDLDYLYRLIREKNFHRLLCEVSQDSYSSSTMDLLIKKVWSMNAKYLFVDNKIPSRFEKQIKHELLTIYFMKHWNTIPSDLFNSLNLSYEISYKVIKGSQFNSCEDTYSVIIAWMTWSSFINNKKMAIENFSNPCALFIKQDKTKVISPDDQHFQVFLKLLTSLNIHNLPLILSAVERLINIHPEWTEAVFLVEGARETLVTLALKQSHPLLLQTVLKAGANPNIEIAPKKTAMDTDEARHLLTRQLLTLYGGLHGDHSCPLHYHINPLAVFTPSQHANFLGNGPDLQTITWSALPLLDSIRFQKDKRDERDERDKISSLLAIINSIWSVRGNSQDQASTGDSWHYSILTYLAVTNSEVMHMLSGHKDISATIIKTIKHTGSKAQYCTRLLDTLFTLGWQAPHDFLPQVRAILADSPTYQTCIEHTMQKHNRLRKAIPVENIDPSYKLFLLMDRDPDNLTVDVFRILQGIHTPQNFLMSFAASGRNPAIPWLIQYSVETSLHFKSINHDFDAPYEQAINHKELWVDLSTPTPVAMNKTLMPQRFSNDQRKWRQINQKGLIVKNDHEGSRALTHETQCAAHFLRLLVDTFPGSVDSARRQAGLKSTNRAAAIQQEDAASAHIYPCVICCEEIDTSRSNDVVSVHECSPSNVMHKGCARDYINSLNTPIRGRLEDVLRRNVSLSNLSYHDLMGNCYLTPSCPMCRQPINIKTILNKLR